MGTIAVSQPLSANDRVFISSSFTVRMTLSLRYLRSPSGHDPTRPAFGVNRSADLPTRARR